MSIRSHLPRCTRTMVLRLCADGAPCRRPTCHLAGSHSRLPLLQLAAPPHRRSRRSWPRSSMWSYSSVRRRTARRRLPGPRSRLKSPYPLWRPSSPSLSVAQLVPRGASPIFLAFAFFYEGLCEVGSEAWVDQPLLRYHVSPWP